MFGVRSLGIGLGVLSSGKGFGVPCSGFGVCGWDRGSDSGYGVWGSGTMFGYVVRGLGYVVHCLGFESPPCRELGAPPVRQSSGLLRAPNWQSFWHEAALSCLNISSEIILTTNMFQI